MQDIFSKIVKFAKSIGVQPLDDKLWTLVAQVFAWAKISDEGKIAEGLSIRGFNEVNYPPGLLKEAFKVQQVSMRLRGDLEAFRLDEEFFDNLPVDFVITLVGLVLSAIDSGQLQYNQVLPEIWAVQKNSKSALAAPSDELTNLVVGLANIFASSSIYCPYDNTLALSRKVYAEEFDEVCAEVPQKKQWGSLLNILEDADVQVRFSDPVVSPSWAIDGQLEKFDYSIAILPASPPYDESVVDDDRYGRFNKAGVCAETLQIIHILKQTNKRAVIVVPPKFVTRTVGLEAELKNELIGIDQCLESVISLPRGSYPGASIDCSILVFNLEREPISDGPRHQIYCLDAAAIDDIDSTVKLIKGHHPFSATVALDYCEKKLVSDKVSAVIDWEDVLHADMNLQVGRYILSGGENRLQQYLEESATTPLSHLAELFRPQPVRSKSDAGDNIKGQNFYEIALPDFPEAGFLDKPSKEIFVEAANLKKALKQVVRPGDVLLSAKGAVGQVAIVGEQIPQNTVAGQTMVILRCGSVDPKVLYMYLKSSVCQFYIKSRIKGSALATIQARDIKDLPVVKLDTAEEQSVIASFEEENDIKNKISRLQEEMTQIRNRHWSLENN